MNNKRQSYNANFCQKVFKKKIGKRTYEAKCPKCKETDVEVIGREK